MTNQGNPVVVPGNASGQCYRRSRQTRVVPAYIDGHLGVAVFTGETLRMILTNEDAHAIADLIIDTLETAPPMYDGKPGYTLAEFQRRVRAAIETETLAHAELETTAADFKAGVHWQQSAKKIKRARYEAKQAKESIDA